MALIDAVVHVLALPHDQRLCVASGSHPDFGMASPSGLEVGLAAVDSNLHGQTKARRSEEHTSELQSLMRISYAVFCLKKKKKHNKQMSSKYRDIKQQNNKKYVDISITHVTCKTT